MNLLVKRLQILENKEKSYFLFKSMFLFEKNGSKLNSK